MKILKIVGLILLVFIVVKLIFSSKYWGNGEQSIFLWEGKSNTDSLCWKQYLGLKVNGRVIFKIGGKMTKCV